MALHVAYLFSLITNTIHYNRSVYPQRPTRYAALPAAVPHFRGHSPGYTHHLTAKNLLNLFLTLTLTLTLTLY